MKPLNDGHLRVLKNLSIIDKCPLLGGNLKKIVTFGTKRFVRYLGCPLLGDFTVLLFIFKVIGKCAQPTKNHLHENDVVINLFIFS